MRIAVFSRSTVDHFASGGMETQLKNLVEGFAKQKHNVTVITTAFSDTKFPGYLHNDHEMIRNGVRYVFAGDTTPGLRPLSAWERVFSWTPFFHRGVQKEGRKNYYAESGRIFSALHAKTPYDLVISQSSIAYGLINLSEFSTTDANAHIPLISIIHGTIKSEIKNRFHTSKSFFNWGRFLGVDLPHLYWELFTINTKFFNRCDHVVAVSDTLRTQFLHEHPEFSEKTTVIYNGVDETEFSPDYSKRKDFRLLFIGRLDREKGIDVILDAARKIPQEINIAIDIIGAGIDVHVKEFQHLAETYQVTDRVHFLGQIPNEKLLQYYQRSSVFVFPTRRQEGHPMTISEAFLSGLPVIASRIGGLPDLIIDGQTGYLIDIADAHQLVEKIRYLYHNKKVLREMSELAFREGTRKYTQKAMVAAYERLFQKKL